MKFVPTLKSKLLWGLLSALVVTLAGCGGGGGTSTAGGGAGVTTVSGTVNGGTASIEVNDISLGKVLIAGLGDILVPAANAAGIAGVVVDVDCGNGAMFSGTTDSTGKFKIQILDTGTGDCTTSFNGVAGPSVSVSAGMETEVQVSLVDSVVTLVSMKQNASSETELEIEVDDGVSDDDDSDSDDDDSSSDDDDSDSDDDDSVSEDDDSDDDDSN